MAGGRVDADGASAAARPGIGPRLRPPRVYPIADLDLLGAERLVLAVVAMASAGATWIQLRAKNAAGAELHALTVACCEALAGSDVLLWLDDRVDVAALRAI